MSTPGLDEVMAFLADRGYSRAASALLDDVLSRGGGAAAAGTELPANLPPLRMSPPSNASSSSDNDDDAFVSMHSSPGMLYLSYFFKINFSLFSFCYYASKKMKFKYTL
jgi:hypothetical protein